jgi:thiol-disulfide isomerase/thioredoxin
MKKLPLLMALLCLALSIPALAGNGYDIRLNMPDIRDTMVYLVHYYGQNRPHIYITDSTTFDKKGIAIFHSTNPDFTGGIYIVLLKDKAQTNFEMLLNKGDNITITARRDELPEGLHIKGSPENKRFLQYQAFIKSFATTQKQLEGELREARTAADTASVRERAVASAKSRTAYTRKYAKTYPNTLLTAIFNAMETPDVPEGPHYLDDGITKDSTFAYRYYKQHYWDNFDFRDDRLIYTPIYDTKLDEYMNKMVLPWPDSVEAESDMLLRKCRGTKDMFHYTLYWLTRFVENSKVMGMDEAFVYLVENYYMKGDAFWLSNEDLPKYINRAMAIAPNVLGNIAPEVKVPNVYTKKQESLLSLKAKYTLLVVYSPTCGHCQHEFPLLDSVYEAVLKDQGVKILTIASEGDEKSITEFLTKQKVDKKWINCWDPEHQSDYKTKYDIISTPTLYLLDEKKIIRGKRLDHSNIAGLINALEKKQLSRK